MSRINPNAINDALNQPTENDAFEIDLDQARIFLNSQGHGFAKRNVLADKEYQARIASMIASDAHFYGRMVTYVMDMANVISTPGPFNLEAYTQGKVASAVSLSDEKMYIYGVEDDFNVDMEILDTVICSRGFARQLPRIGDIHPMEVKPLLCEALNHIVPGVSVEHDVIKTTDNTNSKQYPQSVAAYATPGVGVMQKVAITRIVETLETFDMKVKPVQGSEAVKGNELSSRLYTHLYRMNYSFLSPMIKTIMDRYPQGVKKTLSASMKTFSFFYDDGDLVKKSQLTLPSTGFAPLLTPKAITPGIAAHFIGLATTAFGGGRSTTSMLANQSMHGIPLSKDFLNIAADMGDLQLIFNNLTGEGIRTVYLSTKSGTLGLTAWKLFQKMRKYERIDCVNFMQKGARPVTKRAPVNSDVETPLLFYSDYNQDAEGNEILSEVRIMLPKQSITVGENPTATLGNAKRAAIPIYRKIYKDQHEKLVVRGSIGLVALILASREAGKIDWHVSFCPSYQVSHGSVIIYINKAGSTEDHSFGSGFEDLDDYAYLSWCITRHAYTYRYHRVTWNKYALTAKDKILAHYNSNKTKIQASEMAVYFRCMNRYKKKYFTSFPKVFIPMLTPEEASNAIDRDATTDMEYSELFIVDEVLSTEKAAEIEAKVNSAHKPVGPVKPKAQPRSRSKTKKNAVSKTDDELAKLLTSGRSVKPNVAAPKLVKQPPIPGKQSPLPQQPKPRPKEPVRPIKVEAKQAPRREIKKPRVGDEPKDDDTFDLGLGDEPEGDGGLDNNS